MEGSRVNFEGFPMSLRLLNRFSRGQIDWCYRGTFRQVRKHGSDIRIQCCANAKRNSIVLDLIATFKPKVSRSTSPPPEPAYYYAICAKACAAHNHTIFRHREALLYKPHWRCKTHGSHGTFCTGRLSTMPSFLTVLFLLASSVFAAQRISHATPTLTPFPPGGQPECFTPFDHHSVSKIIGMCTDLLERFVNGFGDRVNTSFRWTGNNSEITHPGIVHLPQVIQEHNQTGACLLEVVDRGNGDSFEPSALMDRGSAILDECFVKDECGEVPLPPHYTTSLAVCGTYRGNATARGTRPRRPVLEYPSLDVL